MTIIISSHILSEIDALCDRYAIINKGKLVDVGMLNKKDISFDEFCIEFVNLLELDTIEKLLSGYDFRWSEKKLFIKISPEEISDILLLLLNNKIKIYSLVPHKNSLEDLYLSILEGAH